MTAQRRDTLLDHLAQAAEHVRQANHATYGPTLTIPELYNVTGALVDTMTKLRRQLNYLYTRVEEAHDQSERYYYDNSDEIDNSDEVDTEYVLAAAKHSIGYAEPLLGEAIGDLNSAWSNLGHIGIREGHAT